MGDAGKTVKRSGGKFAKGSRGGPGRTAKLTDQFLRDLAREFRVQAADVSAMELLEDRDEVAKRLADAPKWLRDRVARMTMIADLAEAALVRRLRAAAGE